MIKYTKLPENIELLLTNAEAYLNSRSDIVFAYLFGGLSKKKPTPLSDVDIAVYLSEREDYVKKNWVFLKGGFSMVDKSLILRKLNLRNTLSQNYHVNPVYPV